MNEEILMSCVRRARQNDEEAFSQLSLAYRGELYRFCMYLASNEAVAHDLVQESFLRAFQKIHTLKDDEGFKPWLFRLAKNLFIDFCRSRKSGRGEVELSLVKNELPIEGAGTEAVQVLHVQSVLQKMDGDARAILMLVDLEGHSYEEAARHMGATEGAVRNRLHRARKEFIRRFQAA